MAAVRAVAPIKVVAQAEETLAGRVKRSAADAQAVLLCRDPKVGAAAALVAVVVVVHESASATGGAAKDAAGAMHLAE